MGEGNVSVLRGAESESGERSCGPRMPPGCFRLVISLGRPRRSSCVLSFPSLVFFFLSFFLYFYNLKKNAAFLKKFYESIAYTWQIFKQLEGYTVKK